MGGWGLGLGVIYLFECAPELGAVCFVVEVGCVFMPVFFLSFAYQSVYFVV